jgi:hypothetical protein
MAKYEIAGNQGTISSSYKTAAVATAPASGSIRRGKVSEMRLGASANPNSTDTYIQFDLSRQTVAPTATAFTPNPTDPADAACSAIGAVNATVEGTITSSSSLFNQGMNQRGTILWAENDESKMLIWPATASNGLAIRAQSSTYTGSVTAQLGFLE